VEAKCEKKPFDRAGKTLKSGHLYQLWAYLTNYARSHPEDVPPLGVLLYATGGSGRDACSSGSRWSRFSYDYRLSGHDLRVRSLDLGASWPELRRDLFRLAAELAAETGAVIRPAA